MKRRNSKRKGKKGHIGGYMLSEGQISAYVRSSIVTISKSPKKEETESRHAEESDKKTGDQNRDT